MYADKGCKPVPDNKEILEAIQGSIEKWEGIVAGTIEDEGTENCPLCQMFYYSPIGECDGCPVKAKTGRAYCAGTPYPEYCNYDEDSDYGPNSEEAKAAAIRELDFLKSIYEEWKK